MPAKHPRWLPHPLWLAASLAVVLAIVVPVAYVLLPDVHQWYTLNQLTADDLDRRERALNYVIRHAGEDPDVRRSAIDRLDDAADRANFIQLVNALDRAGAWSHRHVPGDAWLRWIGVLSEAEETGARRIAAEELAKLTARRDDAQAHDLLRSLLEDTDMRVRDAALRTAALLAGVAQDPAPHVRMIGQRTGDESTAIARRAWILLGLLNPTSGYQANWRDAPPDVAEAILWAAMRTNPDNPQPALEALSDETVPAPVRAMALYTLATSNDAQRAATQISAAMGPLDVAPAPPSPANDPGDNNAAPTTMMLLEHRHIVVTGHLLRRAPDMRGELLRDDAPLRDVKELLSADRAGPTGHAALVWSVAPLAGPLTVESGDELAQLSATALLAYLEGGAAAAVEIADPQPLSSMLRIAALRRMRSPQVEMLEPALRSPHATVRDLACIAAADHLDDDQLAVLVPALMMDFNDDAKMSGAILCGLTGMETDLLRERVLKEDVWSVQKVLEAGLWMQFDEPTLSRRAPGEPWEPGAQGEPGAPALAGLLTRRDLPTSTILLGLMHRAHPAGLDHLLAPHGEPPPDLLRLLVHYRWWHVLDRYLPEAAPPLWLWADDRLQRFQVDVLRAWYLLHRAELTRPAEAG